MSLELPLSTTLGLVTLLMSVLSQAALWQRKEYRWDRMRSFLMSPEGSLTQYPYTLLSMVAVASGWIAYLAGLYGIAEYFGWVGLISIAAHYGARACVYGVHRPEWTQKSLLVVAIVVTTLVAYMYLTYVARQVTALQWATALFFSPLFVGMSTIAANKITAGRKARIIRAAARLRGRHRDVTVVGITGSVGKTSTKHFLNHILEGAGKSVKVSRGHRNSAVTIAIDMLDQMTSTIDIYVAEMAAYTEGEITDLVSLAQPSVGVVTSITNQHYALFGSMRSIARAKWELIRGLGASGVAVLNRDDPVQVRKWKMEKRKQEKEKRSVLWYSIRAKADTYASNVDVRPREISLLLHVGQKSTRLTVPLVGKGALSSLVAAVAAAHALRVPFDHIVRRVQTVEPFDQTMRVRGGIHTSTVIDDSYSASEAAIHNALDHLKRYPQRHKRVVMVPVIELGSVGPRVHRRIGEALAQVACEVYIYGSAYRSDIQSGVARSGKDVPVRWFTNPRHLADEVIEDVTEDSVILLEGRIPDVVRGALMP